MRFSVLVFSDIKICTLTWRGQTFYRLASEQRYLLDEAKATSDVVYFRTMTETIDRGVLGEEPEMSRGWVEVTIFSSSNSKVILIFVLTPLTSVVSAITSA